MKIGILGTGKMSSGLGNLWIKAGHSVCFGSREPDKAKELAQSSGTTASGGTHSEAAAFGEVVVLGVPWSAAEATVKSLNLQGKILIDLTNAVGPDGLLLPSTTSAGEEVAKWARGARVVKAFNTIHFRNLGNSRFGDLQPDVFICGDDASAKAVVRSLVADAGFDPVETGAMKNARFVEATAILWMRLAFEQGMSGETAFKLLRRTP